MDKVKLLITLYIVFNFIILLILLLSEKYTKSKE